MPAKLLKTVAFFGGSMIKEGEPDFIGAYESAKLIAKTGRTVINGGGPGIMYAASKGAKDVKGNLEVVYYEPHNATEFEGSLGRELADHEYSESNYILRTKRLIEMGDAYVVFNGGTGTVSEFAMTWCIARLYFGHNKPLIFYGAFWKNILDAFWNNMRVREDEYRVFRYATTPEQVLRHLEDFETMYQRYHKIPTVECEGDECELFLSNTYHRRGHGEPVVAKVSEKSTEFAEKSIEPTEKSAEPTEKPSESDALKAKLKKKMS